MVITPVAMFALCILTPSETPSTSPSASTTPTTADNREIIVRYNAIERSSIGSVEAKSGYIFFIIKLSIENDGYDSIEISQDDFHVEANNIEYDSYYAVSDTNDQFGTTEILNGNKFTGVIVFEVPPQAGGEYNLTISQLPRHNYETLLDTSIQVASSLPTITSAPTQTPTPEPTPEPTPTPTDIVEVAATKLYTDYAYGNSLAADAKYKDKTVKVTGIVTMIDKELLGRPYVLLAGGGMYIGVQCVFDYGYETELVGLKIGNKITVQGTCEGYIGDVQVHNCVLVP